MSTSSAFPPMHEDTVSLNLQQIGHTLVVMSGKGGVGKSTVAANLAVALAQRGRAVGLLDADLHGPTIPQMLNLDGARVTGDEEGINPVEGPHRIKVISMAFLLENDSSPVIWRGPLKMRAIRQFIEDVRWGPLDYLIIDLPPGTGDEPLSIAHLIPEGWTVIVTTPQDVALLDARKAVSFARQVNLPVLGIIENMSGFTCPHCGQEIEIFKRGGGQGAAASLQIPFLGFIPLDPTIVTSGDAGSPFVLDDSSPAASAFRDIVDRIEKAVEA